jgi:hypothetical protein
LHRQFRKMQRGDILMHSDGDPSDSRATFKGLLQRFVPSLFTSDRFIWLELTPAMRVKIGVNVRLRRFHHLWARIDWQV